jgi:hypothetical protein
MNEEQSRITFFNSTFGGGEKLGIGAALNFKLFLSILSSASSVSCIL